MRLSKLGSLLAAALCVAGVLCPAVAAGAEPGGAEPGGATREPFYTPPVPLPAGSPGDVVRYEPVQVMLAPLVPMPGVTAHRVMYLSTDARNRPIAVTGTVLTPTAPWPGPGQRPIVGYAIGSHGIADACASSRQLTDGSDVDATFMSILIGQGYGLAVTDYEGVGTPAPATWIDRASQGHAVLDALRAAQRLPRSGLPTNGPVATWGYSQGGEGSAAALELHPGYAPELNLIGGFAASIPADQTAFAARLDGSVNAGLMGYLINGYLTGYPELHLADQLNDLGRRFVAEAAVQCGLEVLTAHALTRSATLFTDGRSLAARLRDTEWSIPATAQRVGLLRPTAPVLIGQSTHDDVIDYAGVRQVALDWCARGAAVQFTATTLPTHMLGYPALLPTALDWLAARVNGEPAPTNCARLR